MRSLIDESSVVVVMISYDFVLLGIVVDMIAIMYVGEIVEEGEVVDVYGVLCYLYVVVLFDVVLDIG